MTHILVTRESTYGAWVERQTERIARLAIVNPIGAILVYEAIRDGWMEYCHEQGLSSETEQAVIRELTHEVPKGVL